MIPEKITNEYNKWKNLGLKCYIVKDNISNTIFVSLLPIVLHKNNQWLEVVK